MEQSQINSQVNTTITASEFAAKAQSKKEIYQLLCQEARAYLPEPTLVSIYFLKDLISGKSSFLKQEDVKHLYVPHYQNLTIQEMINFGAGNYPHLCVYFPVQKEQAKLPRQWIINTLYSTIGEPFFQFVKSKTEERNQKVCVKKDLNVLIDPQVLEAFSRSTLVSLGQSGKGASLLKIGSKRKRTKREIEDEKVTKLQQEQEIAQKMAQYDAMQNELNKLQSEVAQHQSSTSIVKEMVNQGLAQVDDQGNFQINDGLSRSGSKTRKSQS